MFAQIVGSIKVLKHCSEFPESLLIVLAYMAACSYVHHLVRPWFAPLDRIRVLADGLVQGTSHAYH